MAIEPYRGPHDVRRFTTGGCSSVVWTRSGRDLDTNVVVGDYSCDGVGCDARASDAPVSKAVTHANSCTK